MQTFAIVTADASDAIRALHDRMPVIVPESEYGAWLHGEAVERLVAGPSAAPLVIDLARLALFANRRGHAGVMAQLACFFKSPLGTAEQDFFRQWRAFEDYVASQPA